MTTEKYTAECPNNDIAAYIDGELEANQAAQLESHLAACQICRTEANQQKAFLAAVSNSLADTGEFPLPNDFTKRIVANAESTVSGLRRPRERVTAMFVCVALFIFAVFALGNDAGLVIGGISSIFEQAAAIVMFAAHVAYNIALGVAVVGRSLVSRTAAAAITATVTVIFVIAAAGFILIRPGRNMEKEK